MAGLALPWKTTIAAFSHDGQLLLNIGKKTAVFGRIG